MIEPRVFIGKNAGGPAKNTKVGFNNLSFAEGSIESFWREKIAAELRAEADAYEEQFGVHGSGGHAAAVLHLAAGLVINPASTQ